MMLKMMRKLRKDDRGFTLIELMVVVIIIGILVAIAVPGFSKASDKAKENACKADFKTIVTAIEMYYADNSDYPSNITTLVPDYLKKAPKDPWGKAYMYGDNTAADPDNPYYLYSKGPDKADDAGADDDIVYYEKET